VWRGACESPESGRRPAAAPAPATGRPPHPRRAGTQEGTQKGAQEGTQKGTQKALRTSPEPFSPPRQPGGGVTATTHGGRLELRTSPGEGAAFSVLLPARG
jgi:Signal transduction histidine kinase